MNTTTLRRPYVAPGAELICLAPDAPVASNKSWEWKGGSKTDSGNWLTQNHWGASFTNVSATGLMEWAEDSELSDN